MKQRIRIIVCAITVCIAVIMSAITIASFRESNTPTPEIPAPQLAAAGYVIREHHGRIAVFSADEPDSPITVTNININALRDSDRRLLTSGISISDEAQVAQLLEDLGS